MSADYWAVIPAAGIGSRMASEIPKQYLQIGNKTILEHTMDCFFQHPKIKGLVIAIADHDKHWQTLSIRSEKPLIIADGGEERCHSVLSALQTLEQQVNHSVSSDDWVLVHDAARPCLCIDDIDRLIEEASEHEVGGVLAAPVRDTMKRADHQSQTITATVERADLWHALTPQMFRLADLRLAIENTLTKNVIVTDEAQAMEFMQKMPLLVEGHVENIKITRPDDLKLAQHYLENLI